MAKNFAYSSNMEFHIKLNTRWACITIIILILTAVFATRMGSYLTILSDERFRLEDLSLLKKLFEEELTCSELEQKGKEIRPRYSRLMMLIQANCDLENDLNFQTDQDTLRTALLRWKEGFNAFNVNDLEGSVSAWRQSSLVVNQLIDNLINEGNILENSGFREDAEKYYRAATLLDPQSWRYEYLGDYYLRTNRQPQAIAAFRQGQIYSKPVDRYYLEGRIKEIKEDWQQAVNNYQQSIQHGGENGNTLFRLAQLYGLRLNDLTKCIKTCERAITVDPSHYACYEFLGNLFQSRGDTDLSIKMYEAGIQNVDGPHAAGYKSKFYSNIGDIYIARGEYEKADVSYHDAINISPYNGDAQRGLANLRIKQGDVQNALMLIDLAMKGNKAKGFSVPIEWYLEQGSYYELAGDYQNAFSVYREVLILDPGNSQAMARIEVLGNAEK